MNFLFCGFVPFCAFAFVLLMFHLLDYLVFMNFLFRFHEFPLRLCKEKVKKWMIVISGCGESRQRKKLRVRESLLGLGNDLGTRGSVREEI